MVSVNLEDLEKVQKKLCNSVDLQDLTSEISA